MLSLERFLIKYSDLLASLLPGINPGMMRYVKSAIRIGTVLCGTEILEARWSLKLLLLLLHSFLLLTLHLISLLGLPLVLLLSSSPRHE